MLHECLAARFIVSGSWQVQQIGHSTTKKPLKCLKDAGPRLNRTLSD